MSGKEKMRLSDDKINHLSHVLFHSLQNNPEVDYRMEDNQLRLLVKEALGAKDEESWKRFVRRYRAEMKAPEASRLLDFLAALSHTTNLSVGCYCADEGRCHRSVLRELLEQRGAEITQP